MVPDYQYLNPLTDEFPAHGISDVAEFHGPILAYQSCVDSSEQLFVVINCGVVLSEQFRVGVDTEIIAEGAYLHFLPIPTRTTSGLHRTSQFFPRVRG